MPDEHGRLTEADNDLIERWWGQHSKDSVICPICKTTNWKIARHLVNIQSDVADANASKAPTYPHIIVTCKSCAYSMFFNAVQIGIAATYVPTGQRGVLASLADLIQKQG
jgi:predicted nucleic-acid-binding Zn-ribbon protein